jgi:predicted nucleotidyltransferase
MTELETQVLADFKRLLSERLTPLSYTLFGSRARGDADEESDLDVLVVLKEEITPETREIVQHCAWKAGFCRLLIEAIPLSESEAASGLWQKSLLAIGIRRDGIPV